MVLMAAAQVKKNNMERGLHKPIYTCKIKIIQESVENKETIE